MRKEKVVRYDSDEAAKKASVTGWVSREGLFYGDSEHVARWAGCTHIICECGALTPKSRTKCPECLDKADRERWLKLPIVEVGDGPFCLYREDRYFWSLSEVYDYCYDEDIKPSDLMLVTCEPQHARTIDPDYWCDDLPEDGDLPDDIEEALEAFNKVIRARKEPLSWAPSDKRVVLSDEVPE